MDDRNHDKADMNDTAEAILLLASLRPWKDADRATKTEQRLKTVSFRLLIAAGCLFILSAIAMALHGIVSMSQVTIWAALIVALASQCLGMLALVLQIAGDVIGMWLTQRNPGESRRAEFMHDASNAQVLGATPAEALDLADQWLEQKLKRFDRRLAVFFGGTDKAALFALIGTGWATWQGVSTTATFPTVPNALTFILAAFCGLAIGAISLRVVADRLAYQREVIALARKLSPTKETPELGA